MLPSESPSWNSFLLHFFYESFGWIAFLSWSASFYPQIILNYQRKSVIGFNFDFLVFNLTKHSSYLIFNASMFFSSVVQNQYRGVHGETELIPVSASDVAFSIHAVLLTAFTGFQIIMYEKGSQSVSLTCKVISSLVWTFALICFLVALPTGSWLWLVNIFNGIQLLMTTIKYIPQAYFNYSRESTEGWSIHNILLDVTGGVLSFLQMGLQSLDQYSIENFGGNIGKLGLSLETIAFDLLFIIQHFFLYPKNLPKKNSDKSDDETLI